VWVDDAESYAPFSKASFQDIDAETGEPVRIGDDNRVASPAADRLDELVQSLAGIVQSAPDILNGVDEVIVMLLTVLPEFIQLAFEVAPRFLEQGGDSPVNDGAPCGNRRGRL